ncbi:hypothetical protein SCA6_011908 [Theobroma cacao]
MGFDRKEYEFLGEIGLGPTNIGCFINGMWKASGSEVSSVNPSNNQAMAKVAEASIGDYEEGMRACSEATKTWMNINLLRLVFLTLSLSFHKTLKSYILLEIIDMCDYVVGLSRQLNGSIVHSECPEHMMFEVS